MITKKLAVTVLLALVLSTAFTFLNQTFAQTTDPQKQKAETLLGILEDSNMSIVLAFSRLDAQNITAADAQTAYAEGLLHAKEADLLVSQEKFSEACTEAVEAMQKFKETLRMLETDLPVTPTQAEVTAEEAISLKANITRALRHVERLENLTARAAAAGYNTTAIEKRLNEVKRHLANATRELRALNLERATEELCIAKTLLDELAEPFARLTNLVTESNTKLYLQAAEVRVSAAKQNITLSTSLTAEAKEDAINALNNSEASLANARDLMADNNVDDAIAELEEAKKWEEESMRAISAVATTPTNVSETNESSTRADSMMSR